MSNRTPQTQPATGPQKMKWIDWASGVFFYPKWPIERRTGHWTQHPGGVMKFHCWDVTHESWLERLSACDAAESALPVDAIAVDDLLRPIREANVLPMI